MEKFKASNLKIMDSFLSSLDTSIYYNLYYWLCCSYLVVTYIECFRFVNQNNVDNTPKFQLPSNSACPESDYRYLPEEVLHHMLYRKVENLYAFLEKSFIKIVPAQHQALLNWDNTIS